MEAERSESSYLSRLAGELIVVYLCGEFGNNNRFIDVLICSSFWTDAHGHRLIAKLWESQIGRNTVRINKHDSQERSI